MEVILNPQFIRFFQLGHEAHGVYPKMEGAPSI